jgi:hypothetical protein
MLVFLVMAAWFYRADRFAPDVIPRVLFSETANCSHAERLLVAGVMQNRIGNPAFGALSDLRAVALQPGAFSCVNDPANSNWQKTRHPLLMSDAERQIWTQCIQIADSSIPPAKGPTGNLLVFYHDKSITTPRSWNNKTWHVTPEVTTQHFVFYSVEHTHH